MLLETFGISLGKTFLDNRGSTVNEFLCFLEAKTCKFLNELNNLKLGSTGRLEDNVEVGLLLSSGSTGCGTSGNSYGSSGGLGAIFLLEDGSEFVYFLYGEVN